MSGPAQGPARHGRGRADSEAQRALADLVGAIEVLVCTGSGGVGKTTTAATLATEGARRGRRAAVVTIDPARRLGDALGLGPGALGNEPVAVHGDWAGTLHALVLDTPTTFDELVTRYSTDTRQAARILGNRFYQNISRTLSGTQEYMAGEKLYELYESGHFDLIVVDTPPTRDALDFLDAPGQLTRLLDHRVYRVLTAPGRGVARVVNRAAQVVVRAGARVVGSDVVEDVVAFFAAFEGMEDGFRDRGERVRELLGSASTAFVLVASPRPDTVAEAAFFSERLAERGLAVRSLVVNRMQPNFEASARPEAGRPDLAAGAPAALGALVRNLADFRSVAAREEEVLRSLAARVAPAPVVRVPLLDDDVHDLGGLARLRPHLVGGE
ncbi:MAG: AAA family ATPase [Acidimicrobiia bacterium]|nr:AAA family ATPase [Acidimicrobiia bacterium]